MLPISSTPRAGCSRIASISESSSRPGFWMIAGRYADLADVVKQSGVFEGLLPVLAEFQVLAEHADALADPLGMTAGVEVLGLDHLDERAHGRRLGVLLRLVQRQCPPGDEQRNHDEEDRADAQSTEPDHRQQDTEQPVSHHRHGCRTGNLAEEDERRGGAVVEPQHEAHEGGVHRQPGDDRGSRCDQGLRGRLKNGGATNIARQDEHGACSGRAEDGLRTVENPSHQRQASILRQGKEDRDDHRGSGTGQQEQRDVDDVVQRGTNRPHLRPEQYPDQ